MRFKSSSQHHILICMPIDLPTNIKRLFRWLSVFALIACVSIVNSHAMSQKIDQDSQQEPYKPARWHVTAVAEDDAAIALKNKDYRLLAFALRVTHIPGVKPEQVQAYREHCGLRFLKGFGDIIHSEEELKRMKQARGYALRYNAVITSECSINK